KVRAAEVARIIADTEWECSRKICAFLGKRKRTGVVASYLHTQICRGSLAPVLALMGKFADKQTLDVNNTVRQLEQRKNYSRGRADRARSEEDLFSRRAQI